jgi:hypothetical protein
MEAKPMKIWNVLEKLLIPVIIGGIGIWATLRATEIQDKTAQRLADQEFTLARDLADREIDLEVTQAFFELMKEPGICQAGEPVYFWINQATPERNRVLSDFFQRKCQASPGSKEMAALARQSLETSRQRETQQVIEDLGGPGQRVARDRLSDLFREEPEHVKRELTSAIRENPKDDQTILNALMVLASVEGGWGPSPELENLLKDVRSPELMKNKTIKDWYRKALENQ